MLAGHDLEAVPEEEEDANVGQAESPEKSRMKKLKKSLLSMSTSNVEQLSQIKRGTAAAPPLSVTTGSIRTLGPRMTAFLFSFLSGDDLLSARLVSKAWLTIIGIQAQ